MKALSSAVLILLTLGLSAQAAGARSQAVTLDPHRSICANGYVRMLEVSGVEEAYSAGLYPWLRATIDQTGFKPGEYPRVTAYYNGGGAADQKWSALLNTLQQAYLSRSPVIIYHAFLGVRRAHRSGHQARPAVASLASSSIASRSGVSLML